LLDIGRRHLLRPHSRSEEKNCKQQCHKKSELVHRASPGMALSLYANSAAMVSILCEMQSPFFGRRESA
jgi:hypothetical protein